MKTKKVITEVGLVVIAIVVIRYFIQRHEDFSKP